MDRRPAVSGAPLHVVDEPADDTPFDVSEADRYLDAGQLGMGGMGEVRATLDRRLDREVALKVTHGPATDDQRRMEREAVLAARLEHPGIVPVYDSGRTPDGRLFYTMRLLKGPTLQMALQDAAGFAERLRLVRRVLDAVQAVAYAHDRRVVHRDLKPANVVLGEHGQTMVVDWGLAVDLDAAPNAPTAGTPAYMPPEQAQGAAPSKTADVFALGGVLYAVLTGAHPTARPVRVVNPEVPADLAAVVDRAMRPAPADRYPDAGAMAEDLEAWFEGRQVAAYSYSPWELLVRLARAWRVPLAVAGVATLGLVGTVAVGVQRTVMERNRALDAESAAVRAEAEANASLADSLVAQALVAAESGDRALAEVFAVHALRFGEDPMARGLLGRFSGEPRPEILGDVPMSGCHEVAIGPGGLRVACLRAGEAVVYEPATGPEPIATLAVEAWSAAFDGRGEHLGLVTADGILGCDLSSGDAQTIADEPEGAFLRAGHTAGAFVRYARGKLAVLRVDSTPEVDLARCPGSGAALRSAYLPDGTPIAACAGRDAFPNTVSSLADPARIWLRMDGQGGPPSALAVGPKGHRVAVGTEAGLVVVVDGDGDEVLRRQTDLPGIHALALSEHRVAIAGTRGGVEVVALDRGALVASLPAGPAEAAWLDEDHLRVADGRIRDWRVPSMAWPHRLEMGAGVADVAVSADGRWIGSVQGNGTLVVVDRREGVPLLSRTLPEGVAKAVAFEPGGGRVAAGTALGGEVFIFDVASGQEVLTLPTWRTRRLAWVGDSLFVAPYMFVLRSFTGVGATESAPVPRAWPVETQVDDMEVTAGGPLPERAGGPGTGVAHRSAQGARPRAIDHGPRGRRHRRDRRHHVRGHAPPDRRAGPGPERTGALPAGRRRGPGAGGLRGWTVAGHRAPGRDGGPVRSRRRTTARRLSGSPRTGGRADVCARWQRAGQRELGWHGPHLGPGRAGGPRRGPRRTHHPGVGDGVGRGPRPVAASSAQGTTQPSHAPPVGGLVSLVYRPAQQLALILFPT